MYGVGVGPGFAVGVGVGVGGVGVGVIVASVPHRRTEPIATLRWLRRTVRRRVVSARLSVSPRVTVPLAVDVTAGRMAMRVPRRVHVPEYRATQ